MTGRQRPPAAPSRATMTGLVLVLTSQCNLRCSYCYQNEKGPGAMSWETARGAIDTLLHSRATALAIDLWGGEPLLELPMMRRIVEYVEANLPAGKSVSYATSTNGALLDEDVIRFLSQHRVETQLSFDGVPAAQSFRDQSSFPKLDRMLRSWRSRDAVSYEELLSIAITVHPQNIGALPDSIRYFHELGVPSVSMAPILTHASSWELSDIESLDLCFEEIFESAVAHYRETGKIPLKMFRGSGDVRPSTKPAVARPAAGEPPMTRALCGVMKGSKPVVDVAGESYGCVTFADSYQRLSTPFLKERLEPLRLGRLTDADYDDRLAAYPAAVASAKLFHRKERKYSSYGRCGECDVLDRCSICPVSIAHIPGNTDPHRIPDFPCAFNLVAGKVMARFDEAVGPMEVLLGGGMLRKKQDFLRLVGRE